MNIWSLN